MNKNEILEKSRNENKKADPYEMEVARKGYEYGMKAGYTLASILFIIHYCQGQGLDYELFAIALAANAISTFYTAIKLKEKKYIIPAVCFGIAVIMFIFLMILEMVF